MYDLVPFAVNKEASRIVPFCNEEHQEVHICETFAIVLANHGT